MVLGKRMEEQLRFAVCYWHSFVWPGVDPVRRRDLPRPWHALAAIRWSRRGTRPTSAFELFRLLGAPFFTFHDRDIAPEGATLRGVERNVAAIGEVFAKKMQTTGVKPALGHGEPLHATGATWPARRPIPIPRSSPTPRRR